VSCLDTQPPRCRWVGKEEIYIRYHDEEWGVPVGNDTALFKKLVLEGFQAGLAWITILRKRQRFVECFDAFDAEVVARYDAAKIEALMQEAGIVRNRAKIEAAISNAKAYLDLRERESFGHFLWQYVDGRPIDNRFSRREDIPAETKVSRAISRALKERGFRFCGPVGIYALMQSVGMVNDHLLCCHRHDACLRLAEEFTAPEA
jgi:DNA-3-methyladenine glycosylase I